MMLSKSWLDLLARDYGNYVQYEVLSFYYFDELGRCMGVDRYSSLEELTVTGKFRIIVKNLIRSGAYSFVVVHNHPDGSVNESLSDVELSRRLEVLATDLGIDYEGSYIVASGLLCRVDGEECHLTFDFTIAEGSDFGVLEFLSRSLRKDLVGTIYTSVESLAVHTPLLLAVDESSRVVYASDNVKDILTMGSPYYVVVGDMDTSLLDLAGMFCVGRKEI